MAHCFRYKYERGATVWVDCIVQNKNAAVFILKHFPRHQSLCGKSKFFTTLQQFGTLCTKVNLWWVFVPLLCQLMHTYWPRMHVCLHTLPILPLTGKVAFPIKLHYITWLRPSVPLSWADAPDVVFSSLFDPRLTGTSGVIHTAIVGLLFSSLSKKKVSLISLLMNIVRQCGL